MLALQIKFQRDFYESHASTILWIDSTHGTNQYRFKLITRIVPDDHGKGIYVHKHASIMILCMHEDTMNAHMYAYI